MQSSQYDSGQLYSWLESFQRSKFSGILYLTTRIASRSNQRSCVLIWRSGEIVYGGGKVLSNMEFADMLGRKFQPNWINVAMQSISKQLTNPASVREMVELLVKIRLFQWESIEQFIQAQVVLILEKFIPYPGKVSWESNAEFDLCYGEDCHGLDWSKLRSDLFSRQEEWNNFAPLIPSLEAVPSLPDGIFDKIKDSKARQHLKQWVDGQRSLIDIAEQLNKDPLKLAMFYLVLIKLGWLVFHEISPTATSSTLTEEKELPSSIVVNEDRDSANTKSSTSIEEKELPMILSVDDSLIVQTSIKRALSSHYQVILASTAMEALNLLNQKPIKLLLLDVTMPDIDGLEICRTIRNISKFRDLPIIMLTARDGLVDKIKGHMAGTTKYLTKPFEPEQLLELVNKYIKVDNVQKN